MLQLEVGYKRDTHPCAGRRLSEDIVTPRLACVRPAASVHPEPGSNSPLYKKFNLLKDSSLPVIHLEFQVTSLPNSYFNIFKELCSVFADCKDNNFISTSQNLSSHYQSFLEQCFQKADAKIKTLNSNLQTFFRFYFEYFPLA